METKEQEKAKGIKRPIRSIQELMMKFQESEIIDCLKKTLD
jgi:hypothetical protein